MKLRLLIFILASNFFLPFVVNAQTKQETQEWIINKLKAYHKDEVINVGSYVVIRTTLNGRLWHEIKFNLKDIVKFDDYEYHWITFETSGYKIRDVYYGPENSNYKDVNKIKVYFDESAEINLKERFSKAMESWIEFNAKPNTEAY